MFECSYKLAYRLKFTNCHAIFHQRLTFYLQLTLIKIVCMKLIQTLNVYSQLFFQTISFRVESDCWSRKPLINQQSDSNVISDCSTPREHKKPGNLKIRWTISTLTDSHSSMVFWKWNSQGSLDIKLEQTFRALVWELYYYDELVIFFIFLPLRLSAEPIDVCSFSSSAVYLSAAI